MKMRDTLARSLGSLRRAKSRTVLTASAIAVGAFSMTMALAMGQGGGEYAQRIITANTDANSLWVMKKQDEQGTSSRPSEYTGNPPLKFNKISVKPIDQYDMDKITAVSGIESVEPAFTIDSAYITRQGQKKYQAVVNVLRPGVQTVYVAGDGSLGRNEAVLPDGYRQALGFPSAESALGEKVSIVVTNGSQQKPTQKTETFTIRGVTRQSSMSLALAPTSLLVTVDAAKDLNNFVVAGTYAQNKYIAANARVEKGVDLQDVKDRIGREGYLAQTPGDVYGALYQFVGVLQMVLLGFGIMAVITAIFGIINTQYISVLERVQEVGLMKALGMDRADVGRLFKIEAGLIGFSGSLIGTTIALVVGMAANPLIVQSLALDQDVKLLHFTWTSYVGVVIALTITSIFAGLFPARRAADLDPIEALRSDRL